MSTSTQEREIIGTEAGSYVVEFSRVEKVTDKSKRVSVVMVKDEHGAQPEQFTMWLDTDDTPPAPKTAIFAFIERSRVTNMQNGRTYENADVRTWTPS